MSKSGSRKRELFRGGASNSRLGRESSSASVVIQNALSPVQIWLKTRIREISNCFLALTNLFEMDALNLAILPTLPFDVQVRIFKAARRTTVFPIHSLPLCRLSKALFPVIQAQIFQSVVLTRHASGRTQQFFSSLNESINRNDDEALGILVKELEYLKVAQSLYDDDLLTLLPHLPNLTRLKIIFMGNLTKRLAFSFDMLADCVPSESSLQWSESCN